MRQTKPIEEELADYGLKIRHSDAPDREPIDFSIEDGEDNVAWVWGMNPNDAEWECNHPYQCIDFGDDELQGECELCGSFCDWHYGDDYDGHRGDPEPHTWYPRKSAGGILDHILNDYKKKQERS